MRILFAASEMTPFCKTGGLADVAGALPPVLAGLGHIVAAVIPGYYEIGQKLFDFVKTGERVDVPVGDKHIPLEISSVTRDGVTVLLLENDEFFGRPGLYGDENGDYPDNAVRFILYSRGVIETARLLGLKPDVVHAHDWQAGLVPAYLSLVYAGDPLFSGTATLFTVHNLGYQGLFPLETFPLTGLPPEALDWRKAEYWGKVSFLKAGIVYADAVSTVSGAYADEITREPLGFGMHGVFSGRMGDLYGIVNGIDIREWDPSADKVLPARFAVGDMQGKKACRKALLDACGFTAKAGVPVFGMVTRLDDQKGLDILEAAVGRLVSMDIRLVILGTGTRRHHEAVNELASRYPDRIKAFLTFDNTKAHLIYAGSDAFLMPSRYEPCGLGQLIAMRYGTLPVVHATGGLKDTVRDMDAHPYGGDGFVFDDHTPEALANAAGRAVAAFREKGKRRWNTAVKRVMRRDFSWRGSAEKYVDLYHKLRNRT